MAKWCKLGLLDFAVKRVSKRNIAYIVTASEAVVCYEIAAAIKPTPLSGKELEQDTAVGFDEMDDIMNQMGLGDDDEEDDDDDDIDLT